MKPLKFFVSLPLLEPLAFLTIPEQIIPFIMYKHFKDKKISNKIKLARVNSKLTNAELREIRQATRNSLYEAHRHLKDAVLKGLSAFNINTREDGIEETIISLIYANSENYNEMFSFVRKTLGKLEDKIS